jgi:LPS O-antigen subunit length determinant protein (WzzB/FepE family)
MTDAEIILIFIGIIGLLLSFGCLIVAMLTFLEKRNKHKK